MAASNPFGRRLVELNASENVSRVATGNVTARNEFNARAIAEKSSKKDRRASNVPYYGRHDWNSYTPIGRGTSSRAHRVDACEGMSVIHRTSSAAVAPP